MRYRRRRCYGASDERSEPRLLHKASRRGRSGDRRGAQGRGRSAGASPRDDRLRELRSAGGPRLPGLGAHEQVRRGLSRQALLRRLRVRGHRRAAGDRPREGALRRRPRERAAALRRAGQLRRLHGAARPGRPHPRHEARPRRPPHARHEDQLLRALLRHRGLRRARGGLAARHGRAGPDRRGLEAEADHRRLVGVLRGSSTSSASARSPTPWARS